jgi:extradiol dioxygenase family protein
LKNLTKDCNSPTKKQKQQHVDFLSYCSLDFIDDQEIQLHHLGVVSSVNAWDPITEEAVLQALELILNPTNYPMMIMCNLGRHRTGIKIVFI